MLVSYPGQGGFDTRYDVREQPYYKRAVEQAGLLWGTPHVDMRSQKVMLSCITRLDDEYHLFRGVAGFEISLSYIQQNLLAIPGVDAVMDAMLVRPNGDIVIGTASSVQADIDLADIEVDELTLTPLPLSDVVAKLQAGEDGWIETEWNGTNVLVVYEHIEALKWYYVVIADRAQLVNGADISHIVDGNADAK